MLGGGASELKKLIPWVNTEISFSLLALHSKSLEDAAVLRLGFMPRASFLL